MERRETRGPGFTLVELLVAISIATLLLAILLPTLGRARVVAKAMACTSNQRQLAIATATYQSDHRGCFPQPQHDSHIGDPAVAGAAVWFNALDAYLNQQRLAYSSADPTARNYRGFKQDPVWEEWDAAAQQENRTLKMNEYLGHGSVVTTPPGAPPVKFYRDGEIRQPSAVVLFVDGRSLDTPATNGNIDGDEFYVRPAYVGPRHDGGANVTHIDGHVAHQRNPTYLTAGGYPAWFDDDDPDPVNRPRSTFNFRPW